MAEEGAVCRAALSVASPAFSQHFSPCPSPPPLFSTPAADITCPSPHLLSTIDDLSPPLVSSLVGAFPPPPSNAASCSATCPTAICPPPLFGAVTETPELPPLSAAAAAAVAAEACPPPPGFTSSCSSPVPPPFPFVSPDTPLSPLCEFSTVLHASISENDTSFATLCSVLPPPPPPAVPNKFLAKIGGSLPPPPPPSAVSDNCFAKIGGLLPPPPPPLRQGSVGVAPPMNPSSMAVVTNKISPAALRGLDNSRRVAVPPDQLMAECVQRLLNFHPELAGRQLSHLNQTTWAQLQQGPQCGIVALSIAAHHLQPDQTKDVSPDTLQQHAVDRGFSKQGEIFSVDNMAELARGVLAATHVDIRIGN